MHPVLFNIGPLKIYSYGLFVFLGVCVSFILLRYFLLKRGLRQKDITDIFFWTVVSGFLTSRLFYILINFREFTLNPWGMIFSRAGFVFQGGLLGGFVGIFIFARIKGLNILDILDISSLSLILGHSLGRIGCFLQGCCFGKPSSWGLIFPSNSPAGYFYPGEKLYPTQIISSVFLFMAFLYLYRVYKKRKFLGEVFSSYLLLYGIFRFLIEFLRGDPRPFMGYFSIFQILSLVTILLGFIFYLRLKRT